MIVLEMVYSCLKVLPSSSIFQYFTTSSPHSSGVREVLIHASYRVTSTIALQYKNCGSVPDATYSEWLRWAGGPIINTSYSLIRDKCFSTELHDWRWYINVKSLELKKMPRRRHEFYRWKWQMLYITSAYLYIIKLIYPWWIIQLTAT